MALRVDKGTLKSPRVRADGTLVVEALLTRSGVFDYMDPDGSIRKEYRPPSEVFNADSMDTFALVAVTNDHPGGVVTIDTIKAVRVGTTGENIRRSDDYILATLAIDDAAAIADLKAGKQEVSCGYHVDTDETPGVTPEGEHYDAIQRNIRGNHVAIVDRGRAGPGARIRMDSTTLYQVTNNPTEIRIDQGTTMNIEQALVKIDQLNLDKLKETFRADQAEAAAKVQAARADKAEAEANDKQAKLDSAEAIRVDAQAKQDSAVNSAVALRLTAQSILPDADKQGPSRFDGKTDREIKIAVVESCGRVVKADSSDDYVNAAFDLVCQDAQAGDESLAVAKASGNVAKKENKEDAEDVARKAMQERHRNAINKGDK